MAHLLATRGGPGSTGSARFYIEGRGYQGARQLMREAGGVWFDHRMADRLREEAPSTYKEIGAVMRAQRDLVRVVRRHLPVLVYKGT